MRLIIIHDMQRIPVDVEVGETVGKLKMKARIIFGIDSEFNKEADPRKVELTYAGATLQDKWIIQDIGIKNGSSMRVVLKEYVKPTLTIDLVFKKERLGIHDKIDVFDLNVADLRSIVGSRTGLPVGVFRLVSKDGEEMYDYHTLRKYNVTLGQLVRLEVWDGWSDFLNVAIMGYATLVLLALSANETEAKYQLKAALHIAAFYGHVDLAVTLLKHGVQPDEPVGYHPKRLWCATDEIHIDSLTTPVHVAVERNNLNVLRSFAHHDITCILARDGHNLTPLQIAIRRKSKACSSFLITQQWKEMPISSKKNISLRMYAKMKNWCERARQTAPTSVNPVKSYKVSKRIRPIKPSVENGVLIDGFSESRMKSRTLDRTKCEIKEGNCKSSQEFEEEPEQYFKLITDAPLFKLPEVSLKTRNALKSAHFSAERHRHESSYGLNNDFHDKSDVELVKLPLLKTKKIHLSPQLERKIPDEVKLRSVQSDESERKENLMQSNVKSRQSMPNLKNHHSATKFSQIEKSNCRSESVISAELLRQSLAPCSSLPKAKGENTSESFCISPRGRQMDDSLARMSNQEFAKKIFKHYEKRLGVSSKEFATRCLSLADSFTEKPWLQRLKQARTIATVGIRRSLDRKPHLFLSE